jgi:hypothetical protein
MALYGLELVVGSGQPVGERELVPGVYERLVDRGIRRSLTTLAGLTAEERELLAAEAPDRLADHVADRLRATLLGATDLGDQVALTQRLLAELDRADRRATDELVGAQADHADAASSLLLDEPASVLTRVGPPLLPGETPPPLPLIPLSDTDLLVNAREEPRLGEALLRELETAAGSA